MHVMSEVTNKKEWTLHRASCSIYEFLLCVYPKHAKGLEQVDSTGGDKTEVAHDFVNTVYRLISV